VKKIAFVGSRKWQDAQTVALKVNELFNENGAFILVSGGADGASKVAEATAHEFGMPVISFRPIKLKGDLTTEDEYGVDEWRLHRGQGKIIHHHQPTWATYEAALVFRSWLLADRATEAVAFWDGFSRGTAFEIELFEGREIPLQVIKTGSE
jgi:predicted Rossmann-fold nucleotide-binding protein